MIRRAQQTGYILLPVIVVITLVAAIALLMNTESALESNTAGSELDAQQARYVAAAGLNHALWLTQQQGCGPYSNLTDEPLGKDKYTTNLTTDLGGTNAVTISVDQDSWIRSDLPTENKAADLKLHTRNETLGTERSLLRYDLSPLAAKTQILSATAWFYVTNAHAAGPIDIHLTSADWTETDATWDSMSANMDSAVLATIPSQPVTGLWLPVNLTAQVQAWVNGQPNFGITLNSTVDGVHGQYNSRESANPPYLEVIVGTPPTSPALLKAVGTLDNGISRSISRNDVTLVQHPAGFSLSRITAGSGQDAMLDSFYNNRDYGVHELEVSLGSGSTVENSVLQFELPAIAPGARIISAQLDLFHYVTTRSTGNLVVDVHRVTRSWVEGTHDGTGTADGATWDSWDGSSSWSSAGGDYEAASAASSEVSPATGDWESWEIAELVRGWIDGSYPNHGLLLKSTGDFDISFASREDANAALHPRLSITYACECGQVCSAPRGSGNILMVVVNPTTLVAEDQQAKDLFESWGYTVSVISESANQTSYDAAVASNDVVFISETVNSNSVGTRLANAPIGVVSQDGDYNPDLGLATGASLKVGTDIDIVDTDHFITRPFPVGPLPIYAAGMEQLVTTGALTADQQTLAEIGGDGSLLVLDQGAAMEGGGSAAGRRVILPLGTRYRFNWDHLNANGRLLVQRALEWGIGAGKSSSGNLLLVVANSASLSSKESAAKALIESWDYTVTPINANALQADYDTALANVDVVYVSGSISSSELGSKLVAATVGVVSEDAGTMDDMGIAEPVYVNRSTQNISVVDNSHYITSGLSIGDLAYVSSSISVWTVDGALAPGLQILGETQVSGTGYPPGVAVMETGASLWGGGSAAGRRVQVPWSLGSSTFDLSMLTAEGLDIMQRALEWGAGATLPPLTQQLLFVVPSPGSLGPTDTAKQALFESWGYTVNQIDDDAPLADYQAAIGANSVAYVAATGVAASVGSKLFKANIGVVNANTGLHNDFGFSTVRFVASTNAPLNTIASHYITQPFGGGQATLYTSDQPSGGAVGTLAADLDQIGSWSSGAISPLGGLVTLDAGAMTSIGENTPARRAQMPWDNLDVSTLSADGLTILRRSLEWAGGADIDLSPVAHWKLDEAVGPTAVDSEGGHDGTWTNGPAAAPGMLDGGLDFDGSNDYVDVPHDDSLSLSTFTISAWIRPDTVSGTHSIVYKGATTAEANYHFYTSGDEFTLGLTNGGWQYYITSTNANLISGQWSHVAANFDGSSGDVNLYLDGTLIDGGTIPVAVVLNNGPITIGSDPFNEHWQGRLDDIRIYDRVLSDSEISDLFDEGGLPAGTGYTEMDQAWSATSDDTWQTVDLGAFGIPANAVVEVAVVNSDTGKEYFGGVRAIGSSLERRIQLHEAEGDGVDAVTMHVQADASSQIQHYSDKASRVSFILLGYWNTGSFVESWDLFDAGASGAWTDHALNTYGVAPGSVAEILLHNRSTTTEVQAGARGNGSSLNRLFEIHEAESGGRDLLTLLVNADTDAGATIEVFMEHGGGDFYLMGYWSAPPGVYTETYVELPGNPAANASWEDKDLSGLGVPADAVANIVIANGEDTAEAQLGVRQKGSGLNRVLNLQEAENGGDDFASQHVNSDSASIIQWYDQDTGQDHRFYLLGWWVLSP